jgi:hypothetical protein
MPYEYSENCYPPKLSFGHGFKLKGDFNKEILCHPPPFLFLLVVHVLQPIIKHFSREGRLLHPIVDDTPCPDIQYVDDTLILIQVCPD